MNVVIPEPMTLAGGGVEYDVNLNLLLKNIHGSTSGNDGRVMPDHTGHSF